MPLDLDAVAAIAADADASDLLFKVGAPPAMKNTGRVSYLADDDITPEVARAWLEKIARKDAIEAFDANGECDFAYEHPTRGRFRVNAFRQSGEIAMVLRLVKSTVPDFEELGLPTDPFTKFSRLKRGLVFVTGITGSGKSTSLAATIEAINATRNEHILTLEDPIEYRFLDNLSIVNQREVGVDTRDFLCGLRNAMREAPDVIMIGEIRDQETMEAAIAAAETGHLVFSTLHTINAIQTVERIMTFFPPHQHDLVRMQLSLVLEGVASQRLIPCVKTGRMVPAVEILMGTPRIRELLREGATKQLEEALEDGAEYYGTQTFNMSLKSLYDDGRITLEDAIDNSDAPDDLQLAIRGITRGTSSSLIG